MEGMGLKFTPVMGRHLLRHSSISGPIAGTSGTHSYGTNHPQLKQSTCVTRAE